MDKFVISGIREAERSAGMQSGGQGRTRPVQLDHPLEKKQTDIELVGIAIVETGLFQASAAACSGLFSSVRIRRTLEWRREAAWEKQAVRLQSGAEREERKPGDR